MSYTAARSSAEQQHGQIKANGRAVIPCPGHAGLPSEVARHHEHVLAVEQVCSVVVQTIKAPADSVWSLVRRFDRPQGYKSFIDHCDIVHGDGTTVGSVRELFLVSGLPGRNSRERLEILDDEQRVISFRILGGEHQLSNYRSVTTVHEAAAPEGPVTMVVESYTMDLIPEGTAEDARFLVDGFIRINLENLARLMALPPYNHH
ncbi:unnamed protein product [Urochloa decumbens]|uniref:Uncharacterized protein n=1 Tax=Urochloa decumbens TaxID=240449 RepID=A0ABC8Z2T4_9POAL